MLGLIACTESSSKPETCDAPIDTVSIIDEITIDTSVYYLVLRIVGWHDKTEIIELYNQKPKFNQCAKSHVEAIFGDSLDSDSTVSHVYLNPQKNTLNVKYVSGKSDKSHNNSLKLELEPMQ